MNLKRRLTSRKFIILIIGVVLFLFIDSFTADHLLIVMGYYVGANTIEKFSKGYTDE